MEDIKERRRNINQIINHVGDAHPFMVKLI
jgi:hypothetical protein